MGRIESESGSPILEGYPRFRYHDTRPKPAVVRLDVADHHALAISGAQINCSSTGWVSRFPYVGALADERSALGGVLFRQESLDRNRGVLGVGDVMMDVGERQLHRFKLDVVRLGR